jgi:hypothetical protein
MSLGIAQFGGQYSTTLIFRGHAAASARLAARDNSSVKLIPESANKRRM